VPDGSATAHIYRPKIATVLAEGYNLGCFRRDMLAALTVAIVALQLSMAIAVASGVSPERGLGDYMPPSLAVFWYRRGEAVAIRSAVLQAHSSFLWLPPSPNSAWSRSIASVALYMLSSLALPRRYLRPAASGAKRTFIGSSSIRFETFTRNVAPPLANHELAGARRDLISSLRLS
jgi:hypothetical protein